MVYHTEPRGLVVYLNRQMQLAGLPGYVCDSKEEVIYKLVKVVARVLSYRLKVDLKFRDTNR